MVDAATPRYLVTTADERTWKFDQPVIFLGEWCCLYERKHVWEVMDAIVAPTYGVDRKGKTEHLEKVRVISLELLSEMTDALNRIHGTTHCVRYWNILLGHWLQRCVSIVLNRYHILVSALQNSNVVGTTILDFSDSTLAANDSGTFIWASNSDVWNHALFAKIIHHLGDDTICRIERRDGRLALSSVPGSSISLQSKRSLRSKALSFVNRVSRHLVKKGDAFIVNSYLPRWEELKLQVSLLQFPVIWRSPTVGECAIDNELRRKQYSPIDGARDLHALVYKMAWQMLPICYLEGYGQLMQQVKSLPWPANPKFVLTSNNFDTDEVFKAWAATKVEQGIPYFVGQHGNNYGTLVGNDNWPERLTADRFFTWGWSEPGKNTVPAFNFKLAGRTLQHNPSGGVLLIEVCQPHRIAPQVSYYEFGRYLEDQFKFVERLDQRVRARLTVRLHSDYVNHKQAEELRWRDFDPSVKLEKGSKTIDVLMAESRLAVHSYDSTGILETLALNIPTLCFWRGGFDHLVPRAKPFYELLRDAKIYFQTPEEAASHISQHWDNIDLWWLSKEVQDARHRFCDEYSRVEERPVSNFRHLLLKQASEIRSSGRGTSVLEK